MAPEQDYYEVLGVSKDADEKEIKRAFLKKARVLHPDVNKEPDAEEKFKQLNEAYSVLSDPQRRSNYDRFGDPDGGGFGGMDDIFGGSGFGMEDLFSTFFGGGAGGGHRQARARGRDMVMRMNVSLRDAATGFDKTVAYDRLAPCDDCGGTGAENGEEPHECPTCHGTGVVTRVQRTILGAMQTQAPCPDCDGTGQVIDHACPTCDGQGRTPSHDTVTVHVPAGVYDGQDIVIEHMGEAGVRGEAAGDLVIRVSIEESEEFVRQGNDLLCLVEVDLLHALVGTKIEKDGILPDEKVEIDIPAGVEQGERIVVEGKGMPVQGTKRRGDLVAVISLVQPKDLEPSEMETLEGLVAARDGAKDAKHMADDLGDILGEQKSKPKPKKKSRFGKRGKKK
jgi:molecular chaperone DnaJ